MLVSWAVPRGPSLDPREKTPRDPRRGSPAGVLRLRGRHPGGAVRRGRRHRLGLGRWTADKSIDDPEAAVRAGELKFRLDGEKLRGEFVLVRTGRRQPGAKEQWLLIHRRDGDDRAAGGTPRTIPRASRRGARTTRLPRAGVAKARAVFIPPMLATLVAGPFDDPDFLYEIKWDGFRIEAVVDGGGVRLYTRGGQDGEAYFGAFLDPGTWIDARSATVDGEVVALGPDGEPDFALLQSRIKGRKEASPATRAGLPGVRPARARRTQPPRRAARGAEGAPRGGAPARRARPLLGARRTDGIAFYEAAQARGLEGIMAKDRRSTYLPGRRSMAWQKVKIRPEQELVVGGWTAGKGALEGTLGALLVGVYEDGRLRYAGKVGAGFNRAGRDDLLSMLAPLGTPEPPFDPATAEAPDRRHDVGAAGGRDPRGVRRLDRGRPRPAGGGQGARPGQGPTGRGARGRRLGALGCVATSKRAAVTGSGRPPRARAARPPRPCPARHPPHVWRS